MKSGNHAALYLGQDRHGILVLEQYVGLDIQTRHIRFMDGRKPYQDKVAMTPVPIRSLNDGPMVET